MRNSLCQVDCNNCKHLSLRRFVELVDKLSKEKLTIFWSSRESAHDISRLWMVSVLYYFITSTFDFICCTLLLCHPVLFIFPLGYSIKAETGCCLAEQLCVLLHAGVYWVKEKDSSLRRVCFSSEKLLLQKFYYSVISALLYLK